ncbi:ead/Ea22-like family protein [Escherichia coli]|uniref:ead/Ea22-like family protein n=1 Tax=Escherichia coli TaxID=562 RepID=UPI0005A735CC|nr:ead/Ea22-like family protein [Escherichia coli]EFH0032789.1 ead/Ea22-like family protein [Escherichia coli]EMB3577329.1 ead/Ea22-like family protein [Escherichia coli]
MSEINYQALREKAEKATKGSYIVGHTSVNQHGNLTGVFVCQKWKGEPGGVIAECHVNCLVETDVQAYANAEFIAAFNPKVALALLDERERNQQYIKSRDQENEEIALTVGKLRVELEAAKKRIAELEKSEEQLINERDHAESALADMYFAATGDRPEWSNWFGFSDAVDAVVDRIADLEAKQCIEEMSKQSCEARERDLFESWVMHSICISKSTLEGLRTETGYRNATLSGTDFNRMWEQWKSIRAAGIRIKGE